MIGISKYVTKDTGTRGLFQYFIKVVPTRSKGNVVEGLGNRALKTRKEGEGRVVETNHYF